MRLDGSSKISARRDMVADFQSRQDIFVFLLSTRAGGLGINLTAADTVSSISVFIGIMSPPVTMVKKNLCVNEESLNWLLHNNSNTIKKTFRINGNKMFS